MTFVSEMPAIENIGEFARDETFDDWWISPEIPIPFLDGNKMSIRVIDLDESELDGGKFPSSVEQTVRSFLKLDSADRRATNPQVYENYVENRDYSYCFLPWMLLGASQVWRYNRPTSISVMRDFRSFDDSSFYVVVAFDCKWEDEHGLALVYHEGRTLIRVGPDDGHIHDFRPPRPETDEQAQALNP